MIRRVAPEFQTLAMNYGVNVPDVVEAIYQPFYDRLDYAAAGQTELRFFQTPIGQGGKTVQDTNMVSAGVIAAPQQFLATQICLEFIPDSAPSTTADATAVANDVAAVLDSGVVEFNVGNKNQLRDAPIGVFPPTHVLDIDSSTTVADASIVSATNRGQMYDITPVNIPFSQNFDVSVKWTTPAALPSGNAGSLRCHLNGYLYRSAQ